MSIARVCGSPRFGNPGGLRSTFLIRMVPNRSPGVSFATQHCFGSIRAPAAPLVLHPAAGHAQRRLDDSPGGLDRVLACKQHSIAMHCIADESLISIHAFAALVAAIEFDVPPDHRSPRLLCSDADCDRNLLRPELKA